MPPPPGAIGLPNLGYPVGRTLERLYFGHGIAASVEQWADGQSLDPYRLRARYRSCVTVPAGNAITIGYGVGVLLDTVEVRAGPLVRAWSVNAVRPACWAGSTEPVGAPVPHALDWETSLHPRSRIGRLSAYASTEGIIHAIHVELYHADDYDDGPAEVIDRGGAADVVYQPDMPLSSWQAQKILCETYDKLGYQARLAVTLPLFKTT